jgi:hypothetical protein
MNRKTVTLRERITPEAIGRNWRRIALVVVLALLALRAIAVYGDSPAPPGAPPPAAAPSPGSPAVYERINALTDCAALQVEFDTAYTNHGRDVTRGRLDL